MIKATDLRLGNLVMDDDDSNEIFAVESITKGEKPFTNENWFVNGRSIEDIVPVELTEYWLLSFGFEKLSGSNGWYFITIKDLEISVDINNFEIALERNCQMFLGRDKPCKYIHDLQNLIFVLTKEELQFKKPTI